MIRLFSIVLPFTHNSCIITVFLSTRMLKLAHRMKVTLSLNTPSVLLFLSTLSWVELIMNLEDPHHPRARSLGQRVMLTVMLSGKGGLPNPEPNRFLGVNHLFLTDTTTRSYIYPRLLASLS